MSLFRLSATIVSRGNSGLPTTKSAVAAASYNAREPLFDERQGVLRDMCADKHDLITAEILLPLHAPERWLDRETLWNEVEHSELRSDAQVARAIVLSLPRELSVHENVDLARDFFMKGFVSKGMVVDVAVHEKAASDGLPQPHAHALLTMRRIVDGAFALKERAWNTAATLHEWRSTWSTMVNERLSTAGSSMRVDHRAKAKLWIEQIAKATSGSRDAIRSQLEREGGRARTLVDAARPVAIRSWRRVEGWLERRREPMSQQDVVEQLRQALWDRGLRPTGDPVLDGKWHRTPVEGDTGHKKSGSYIAYGDGRPAGYIQNYKGESGPWKADGTFISDPTKLAAAQDSRRAQREAAVDNAESYSRQRWSTARPAPDTHPYLERKGIDAVGARVTARGDLLVPMQDIDGRLWGVQTITAAGEKFFPKGGRIEGTHAVLGQIRPGEPVVVVEGWSTAKTVHAETGLAVIAAFNAGNVASVAKAYSAHGHEVIVASDNDHGLTLRNPPLPNVGLEKGLAAAVAVGGKVMTPQFHLGEAGTDWNDYAKLHGKGAVRRAFEREGIPMSDTKQEATPAPVIAETTQAQREAARQVIPALAAAAMNADTQAHQASQRAQLDAQRAQSVASL